MSSTTNRRILSDFNHIKTEYERGIFAEPLKDNIYFWQAVVFGPSNSIWDGGCFKLTVEFPKDYPIKPPSVKFISKMFHPNSMLYI